MPRAPLLLALALPAVLVGCPLERCAKQETSPAASSASSAPSSSPPASASSAPAAASAPKKPTPCPEGMALIDRRFCIDRWEASVTGEDEKPHSPFHPVKPKERMSAVSRAGVHPQAHISMFEAERACKRSNKYLCTTQEWIDACMGAHRPKRTYPYGPRRKKGACNDERRLHPVAELYPGSRRRDSVTLNNPKINQLENTLAKAGQFEQCVTPEGVHDMVGNLLEWTRGHRRPLLMGGHYVDSKENGDGCRYVTPDHKEHYHDFTTGFRCCAKPDESQLVDAAAAPASADGGDAPTVGVATNGRSFTNPVGKLPRPKPPPYEPTNAPCPVDMVLVEGTRCGLTVQVCKGYLNPPGGKPGRACREFVQPTRCKGAQHEMRFCIDRHEFTPEGEKLPLVYVSWAEAQKICRGQDKRICFEREWEFACEGTEGVPYPYGYVRDGKKCNHDRDNLFVRGDELVDHRVPAKSLPECKSPFGVFNLVGNVDEWVHRPGNKAPNRSVLRGGWWLTGRNRCRAATESHNEIYAGPQTGVRCCKPAR